MILVTGGSGFTGGFVIEELKKRQVQFKCLVRNPEKQIELEKSGYECVPGNVHDPNAWDNALSGCESIINIVSFNQDHISLLLEKAKKFGIKRLLFISTTAIFTNLPAKSKILRTRIEKEISESGTDWTVLRPTMIYGASGDRNMERLIKVIKKFPVHPILGTGNCLIQPICVQDLSKAIVDAFFCPQAYKKAYNLSGLEALSYKECVKTVAKKLNKKITLIPLPVKLAYMMAAVCYRIPLLPDIKGEQVLRLNEDKDFSHKEAAEDFGFSPIGFEEGISREIKELFPEL